MLDQQLMRYTSTFKVLENERKQVADPSEVQAFRLVLGYLNLRIQEVMAKIDELEQKDD